MTEFLDLEIGKRFYEFFIQDSDSTYIPIPILILNYEDLNGNKPNADSNMLNWKLVSRF